VTCPRCECNDLIGVSAHNKIHSAGSLYGVRSTTGLSCASYADEPTVLGETPIIGEPTMTTKISKFIGLYLAYESQVRANKSHAHLSDYLALPAADRKSYDPSENEAVAIVWHTRIVASMRELAKLPEVKDFIDTRRVARDGAQLRKSLTSKVANAIKINVMSSKYDRSAVLAELSALTLSQLTNRWEHEAVTVAKRWTPSRAVFTAYMEEHGGNHATGAAKSKIHRAAAQAARDYVMDNFA